MGLSQSFPSLGPGELIQASPYTARSSGHPCLSVTDAGLYYALVTSTGILCSKKYPKKKKREKGNEVVQELNIEDS